MIFQIGEKITNYSGTVSTEKSGTIRPKSPRIIDSDLLSRPDDIKTIITSTNNTVVNANYTLKVTDRNIDPSANWKMFFNDPADKFQALDSLPFLESLDMFFVNKRRGGAENSGGSTIIFPNFNQPPYSGISNSNKGFGIKNSRSIRKLILEQTDLEKEKAIHFPARYDDNTTNGLETTYQRDSSLNSIFSTNNSINSSKWKRIVNAAFRNKISFDILIPRAERTKHTCYYNPFSTPVVLSTNFFYFSGFQNGNNDTSITSSNQIKFITAYLNSCFGQIQFEIHSNNQEGLRKLEGFHINELKVPDLKQLTKAEINSVVTAFENFNNLNVSVSGDEGLASPRRQLDLEIANIIFSRDNLGFQNSDLLTDFFELFLADLVEDRRL